MNRRFNAQRARRLAQLGVQSMQGALHEDGGQETVPRDNVLNLWQGDLGAIDLGDFPGTRPAAMSLQDYVRAIKAEMARRRQSYDGAAVVDDPTFDNLPPEMAGGSQAPALQLPDGMR